MNYLLDTHILLWYIVGDQRISNDIQSKIENFSNTIYLSNVSLWEIAIKGAIGKPKLKVSIKDLKDFLDESGVKILEYDIADLETLLELPLHHQDPYDRMLVFKVEPNLWKS